MMKLNMGLGTAARKVPQLGEVPTPELIVQGGEVAVPQDPAILVTILGPCVSVCLFDPRSGVGGMSHFLLPVPPNDGQPNARYGQWSQEELIRRVIAVGARRERLVAKVFGGAHITKFKTPKNAKSLGRQNWETALRLLEADGIPVLAKDVGKTFARKVIFKTDDVSAWVKRIESR